jgi:hypothetical protein
MVIGCPSCEPLLTYTIYTYYSLMYPSVSWFETFTNKTKTTFKKLIEEESSQVIVCDVPPRHLYLSVSLLLLPDRPTVGEPLHAHS